MTDPANATRPRAPDDDVVAEAVSWIREAADRITGGNCLFVDDDLKVLEHLAQRAVDAGLIDQLGPKMQASVRSTHPADIAPARDTEAQP